MNLTLVGTKVIINNKTLMFEQDNLTATINLIVDTTENYTYKLDMQMPKLECSGVQLYNVLQFMPIAEQSYKIEVTDSMFPVAGKYICQIRGINGDKVFHSQNFEVWVKFSALPYHVWNPVPSEFFQIESDIGEIASHPPYPNGDTGYWMIWNPTTKEYEQSEYPIGATLPQVTEQTNGKYLSNNGENAQWVDLPDFAVSVTVNGATHESVDGNIDIGNVGGVSSVNEQTPDANGNVEIYGSNILYEENGDSLNNLLDSLETRKMDRDLGATNGNLAEFNGNGDVHDSGYSVNDFTSALGNKQDTISDLSDIRSGATLGASSVQDVTINNSSIVEQGIAKIIYETGLGNDSDHTATVTAIRAFVNDSINSVAAYYITSNAQGDAFATKAALDAGGWYYAGQLRTPTRNDYAIVIADETHDGKTARYTYTENQWAFQYTFSMQFTQPQLDALNSGINSTKVALYDAHIASTANPHNVTKSQIGLSNVDNVQQYSSTNPPPYPVTSVNGETGDVSLDASDVGAQAQISVAGVLQGDGSGGISERQVDANPTQDSTNLVTSGGVYTALTNKQDSLPTVVNDRYLHTNATTGALEWSEVQGGGSNGWELIDARNIGYSLTLSEPSDFTTNYSAYYTQEVKDSGVVMTALSEPATWEAGKFYSYNSAGTEEIRIESLKDGEREAFSAIYISMVFPSSTSFSNTFKIRMSYYPTGYSVNNDSTLFLYNPSNFSTSWIRFGASNNLGTWSGAFLPVQSSNNFIAYKRENTNQKIDARQFCRLIIINGTTIPSGTSILVYGVRA